MAKVTLVKKSACNKLASGQKAGPVVDYQLIDNEDLSFSVSGVDSQGNAVPIDTLATLTPAPSSDDVTVLTVAAPVGMTFVVTATGKLSTPGTPVHVLVTATWTSGSPGPFVFTQPFDVVAGAATGITVVPGTPTTH